MRTALKWTAGLLLLLLVSLVLFIAFGLNTLRGPISRAVTDATGRELRIDGDLRARWSWTHPRFRVEKVSFDNAPWAREDYLFTADAIEASVRLLPLLRGAVVIPELHLEGATVSLEQDADGKKNWVLEKDEEKQKEESRVDIERLTLDRGQLNYVDAARDIDIEADLNTDATGLVFATTGTYQGNELSASGHAGQVLSLRDETTPFPLKGEARIGETRIHVDGSFTGLVGFKHVDTKITLSGKSMDDLYDIVGVALPATKAYTTSGRILRYGNLVRYENFTGKVGESDIAGTIEVDTGGKRPFMKGNLVSKVLNFADLGALVGTDRPRESSEGVLPEMPFEPDRWDSVDADVRIKAGSIQRPRSLPIENLTARIQMRDRVLTVNPLEFGIAGGKLAGPVKLDGSKDTIAASLNMRVQKLQLNQLFPTIKENRASVGDIGGLVELSGSGNSVGKMLGSANGKIGVFMDGGEISQFMMELVALDLWGVARVKLRGDKPVPIRCAVADFDVKSGVMNTNAFVFDTSVVLVEGGGTINLKTEEMDIKLNPKPKDGSIASLNSPLYVRGTFGNPKPSPDVGRLAAKGLGAVVMGIINPLLAVIPLLKEGKEQESNCAQLIAESTAAKKAGAAAKAAPPSAPAASAGASKPATSGASKPATSRAPSSDQSGASGATASHPPAQ